MDTEQKPTHAAIPIELLPVLERMLVLAVRGSEDHWPADASVKLRTALQGVRLPSNPPEE